MKSTFTFLPKRLKALFSPTITLLMVFLLFSIGCKKGVEETGTTALCPEVIATDPIAGAINVPTTKVIAATFNVPMNPATINNSTFLLQEGTVLVSGAVSYTGSTASFTPSVPLKSNTVYTATITTGAKDNLKSSMIQNYVWSFNTGAVPTVVSTDPVNNAANVGLAKIVSATFSTGMNAATINTSSFILKQGTTLIPGGVTYSGTTATFTPVAPFLENTVYTATIVKTSKDLAGNAMIADYTWSFATGTIPIVVSTSPVDGATDVMLNKVITASFSKVMNPLTINSATFLLSDGTTPISGTITYSGNTAAFKPSVLLLPNTLYTATITTGVRDSSGNATASNYTWTFRTGVLLDAIRPTVIATDPTNGTLSVPVNKVLTATFSENMDSTSINTTTFLVKNGSATILGTVTYSGRVATFVPTSNLASGTLYTGTITIGARDVVGNTLAVDYNWNFTTIDIIKPTVLSTDPTNGATNVPLNKVITATFSEDMDPSSISNASFLVKNGSTNVPGTVTYTGRVATFVPTNNLANNTLYTGTITTAAKDMVGNTLATDYSWTFTTLPLADIIKPTVLSTDPSNGATGVALNKVITATFSENMDPSSISNASFTVKNGATAISGSVSYTGVVATFVPTSNLAENTLYTGTITTAAKDVAGNTIASNYIWTFTTILPVVIPPVIPPTLIVFGVFGGSAGITNQGVNTVINNGGIGTTAASTLITGFHDMITGDVYTETPLNIGRVNGRIHTAPPAPGSAASAVIAAQGLADANALYLSTAPAAKPGGIDPGAGELGGLTLAPGIYKSASGTFNISNGNLTLDAQGDPNAVWIFQTAAGLTVGIAGPTGAKSVIMINGGQPKNVFWHVGSAATINGAGGGVMVGTIIAYAGVTFSTAGNATQTVLNGRALSLNASVTLVNTTINVQ
ncbi:MAG: hypothetical protein C0446_04765 [Chitinophaga sp.]|nr:hypothetical protein [Chitinophaga sp.]